MPLLPPPPPAKLLHVVMIKRPLNLFMAENYSESVDVDPHPNTDTPGTVTCLPVAASVVLLLDLECLKLKRVSFFLGYAFGYGPKATGAT